MTSGKALFRDGARVRLRTFDGTVHPQGQLLRCDNYWLLIGENGVVVDAQPATGIECNRVLIKFDVDVQKLDLACHNEVPNSLWIKRSDLELI